MTDADYLRPGPSLLAARTLFATECALSLGAALPLFVFTRSHGTFFAFLVDPPMTAAFLGANFAGGSVMKFAALGERRWANARQSVPGTLVYVAAVGVVTARHLDQFNPGNPVAVIWIVTYLAVPFFELWVLWWYQRRRAPAEVQGPALAPWVCAYLTCGAVVLLGASAGLVAAPSVASDIWPWGLVPEGGPYAGTEGMTGYVVAWLLGIGVTLAHAAWENDARRSRCVFVGAVALGLLNLVGLARFASEVRWTSPATWTLMALLVTLLGASGAGLRAGLRGPISRPPPMV